jgi:hypothetical protein
MKLTFPCTQLNLELKDVQTYAFLHDHLVIVYCDKIVPAVLRCATAPNLLILSIYKEVMMLLILPSYINIIN